MGSEEIWKRRAALTSRLQSIEIDLLDLEENLVGLAAINASRVSRRLAHQLATGIPTPIGLELGVFGGQQLMHRHRKPLLEG